MKNMGLILKVVLILLASVLLFALIPNFWSLILVVSLIIYFFWILNQSTDLHRFNEKKLLKLFGLIFIFVTGFYLRGWQFFGLDKSPYVENNQFILALQHSLSRHINGLFGGEESGLVAGILLGFKTETYIFDVLDGASVG